jgi:hypothetical protein
MVQPLALTNSFNSIYVTWVFGLAGFQKKRTPSGSPQVEDPFGFSRFQIIILRRYFFIDILVKFLYLIHEILFTRKAKPSVRRGQKAPGLFKEKTAELPKDEPFGSSAFYFKHLLFHSGSLI